jgi:hypothetical protein
LFFLIRIKQTATIKIIAAYAVKSWNSGIELPAVVEVTVDVVVVDVVVVDDVIVVVVVDTSETGSQYLMPVPGEQKYPGGHPGGLPSHVNNADAYPALNIKTISSINPKMIFFI